MTNQIKKNDASGLYIQFNSIQKNIYFQFKKGGEAPRKHMPVLGTP